jgi:hypothetical protein
MKSKLAKALHLSSSRPQAYTGLPYTTLSRQNPRVYLCSVHGAAEWIRGMGYGETPYRDHVARILLKIIDACNDAIAVHGT